MLRTDANAIPVKIACSSLPGITCPSNRQSKKRSARTWGDRAPVVSGYQIVSAMNRTVESITSGSVVESSIHEIQRASALETSQSIKMSSKIRIGDATTTAICMCSASSATAGTQRKLSSALRIPERKRLRLRPRFLVEGRDAITDRSGRANAASLRVRYPMVAQMAARMKVERGVWYGQL